MRPGLCLSRPLSPATRNCVRAYIPRGSGKRGGGGWQTTEGEREGDREGQGQGEGGRAHMCGVYVCVCVCVCVCANDSILIEERERERERGTYTHIPGMSTFLHTHIYNYTTIQHTPHTTHTHTHSYTHTSTYAYTYTHTYRGGSTTKGVSIQKFHDKNAPPLPPPLSPSPLCPTITYYDTEIRTRPNRNAFVAVVLVHVALCRDSMPSSLPLPLFFGSLSLPLSVFCL
ncbi:hypothetical protein GGS23DRAFT_163419 [Durotheca rogersii]|uniref:uncharacterized protein n=1 Tax=Durotheca rogersii TaxID=419775 RepID=UPI0022204752|nr:uncharacterized protein GGS23DRAFT_163419 [Durotheca rogersii]KAI5867151.1 hypothetical protein GGS23DRAFT_163419 [Durotheca rogersii]